MTSIKKFGFSAVVAALFAVMAFATMANTAFADIDELTTDDGIIGQGDTATLTATFDAEPADGDEVTFAISASSDADGGLGDDEDDQIVECTIDDTANGLTTASCDDGTAEVDITNAAVTSVTITLTAEDDSPEGDLDVVADHEGGSDTVTVVVTGDAGDADNIEVDAPAVVEEDGEIEVEVTVTDDDGDPVENVVLDVFVDGELLLLEEAGECQDDIDDIAGDTEVTTCDSVETDDDGETTVVVRGEDDEAGGSGTLTFQVQGEPIFGSVEINVVSDDVATVEITAEDEVEVGSVSDVTVTVEGDDGNPVPEGTDVEVDASAGVIACQDEEDGTEDGMLECDFIAPGSAQNVVITAVSDGVVGTATVTVGDATDPTPEPTEGFDRPISDVGVNTAIWGGGTVTELAAATAAAGGISVTVFVGGDAKVLIPGAPAFVNAEFNAAFPGGVVPDGTIVLVVR